MQDYNDVFDNLLQKFRDKAAGDTLVVVHRVWKGLTSEVGDLRAPFSSILCYTCLISGMQVMP